MKNTEHARLLDELADELYASCKTKPVDSPNYKRQSSLMQRARKAADEIEGREGHDFSVGDLIDQEWDRQRCFTTDDGDRMFSQDDFECAIRRVLDRVGGGEGLA